MDTEIGTFLKQIIRRIQGNERVLRRLRSLRSSIPHILSRMPETYWHSLDGNAKDQVCLNSGNGPVLIKFKMIGSANTEAHYHALRPVVISCDAHGRPHI